MSQTSASVARKRSLGQAEPAQGVDQDGAAGGDRALEEARAQGGSRGTPTRPSGRADVLGRRLRARRARARGRPRRSTNTPSSRREPGRRAGGSRRPVQAQERIPMPMRRQDALRQQQGPVDVAVGSAPPPRSVSSDARGGPAGEAAPGSGRAGRPGSGRSRCSRSPVAASAVYARATQKPPAASEGQASGAKTVISIRPGVRAGRPAPAGRAGSRSAPRARRPAGPRRPGSRGSRGRPGRAVGRRPAGRSSISGAVRSRLGEVDDVDVGTSCPARARPGRRGRTARAVSQGLAPHHELDAAASRPGSGRAPSASA